MGDEANFAVMGGSADVIAELVSRGFSPGLSLADAAQLAVRALSSDGGPNAAPRVLGVEALEVAVLDRTRAMPRKFRRIKGDRLAALLADGSGSADERRRGAAEPGFGWRRGGASEEAQPARERDAQHRR